MRPPTERIRRALMIAVPAAAALALTVVVATDRSALTRTLDLPVDRHLVAARTGWLTAVFRAVTWLGDPTVVTVALLLCGAFTARTDRRLGVAIALLAAARALVSWSVKVAVDRPRPTLLLLAHPSGASYPSGHALGATLLWGSLALVAQRFVRSDTWRRVAVGAGALVVLAVMTSRLYLGVHWLTDVVGGALFGLTLLAVVRVVAPVRTATVRTAKGGAAAS